jgi:GntR family transcriptional regulator, transcriptional repressor for pyruvate dehydrogenase complex
MTTRVSRPKPRLPKASEILANMVKVRILSGGMKSGERLPAEAELMEEYGFSRGTVREAIRLLESDGLIHVRRGPRGGIEVSEPDVSQVTRSLAVLFAYDGTPVSDLMNFRLVIEPGAAAMAARDATPEQRARLLTATQMNGDESIPHSVDFHRELGTATNNGFMSTILTAVYEVLEWQTNTQQLSSEQQADTSKAHLAIARAISSGNASRAERAMRNHIEEYTAVLGEQGRLSQPIIPRPTVNVPPRDQSWF